MTTASAGQLFRQPKQARHLSRSTNCFSGLIAATGHFFTQVRHEIHLDGIDRMFADRFLVEPDQGQHPQQLPAALVRIHNG